MRSPVGAAKLFLRSTTLSPMSNAQCPLSGSRAASFSLERSVSGFGLWTLDMDLSLSRVSQGLDRPHLSRRSGRIDGCQHTERKGDQGRQYGFTYLGVEWYIA